MMNKMKKSFIQKLLPRTGYFIDFVDAFLPIFLFYHKAKGKLLSYWKDAV